MPLRLLLAAAALGLAACQSPGVLGAGGLAEFRGTATLQGAVVDGVTGARLGGGDLSLTLVQGAELRTPTRVHTAASDPLLGEYAFSGIPIDVAAANRSFKLVVLKPGYRRFEADLVFAASLGDAGVVDTVYNMVGNVYLFPLDASTPDLTVTVTFDGAPVPGAQVLLTPYQAWDFSHFVTGDALPATPGLLVPLAGTTDAAGRVVFEGSRLVLGAVYYAHVLPLTLLDRGGTPLTVAHAPRWWLVLVGLSATEHPVALVSLDPGGAARLYVTAASNQAVGQLQPSGDLAVSFNQPVALVEPDGFGLAALGTTGVLAAPPVAATLSADARTLTLSPRFSTPIGAADRGTILRYSDGTARVSPRATPALAVPLFGLTFADGTALGGDVAVRAP